MPGVANITFRRATALDAEVVSRLVNSAYRGESSKAGWTTEAALLDGQRVDAERLRELIAADDQVVWLAFVEGRLEGCVHLALEADGRAFLGMLTVEPTRQARGLGRRMITHAEVFVQEAWRRDALYMTVISVRAELIAYYARRGYLPTGEVKAFPSQEPRFGVPRRDDLQLVVLRRALPGNE